MCARRARAHTRARPRHPTDLVDAGIFPPFPTPSDRDGADGFVAASITESSDYIKIIIDDGAWLGTPIPTLSQDQVRAVVAAAHERGMRAIAHASTHAEAEPVLAVGVDGLAHVFRAPSWSDALAGDPAHVRSAGCSR